MNATGNRHTAIAGRNDQSIVDAHLNCADCGYDLHGLSRKGKCPECGLDVSATIERLRHDKAWLVSARAGVLALIFAYSVLITTIILLPFLPLGLCFFIFLQLGASVELEPRIAASETRLMHFPARIIGTAMVCYVIALLLLFASTELAIGMLVLAILIHLAGAVSTWSAFIRRVGPILPPESLRLARGTLLLHYVSAGAGAVVVVSLPLLELLGTPATADWIAGVGILLAGLLMLLTVFIALFPLQRANVILHDAVRTGAADHRGSSVEPAVNRDR